MFCMTILSGSFVFASLTACSKVPRNTQTNSEGGAKTSETAASTPALPIILPGESCKAIRSRLSKEAESEPAPSMSITWEQDATKITAFINNHCVVESTSYSAFGTHIATTPDGAILGKDTIQTALEKLGPKLAGHKPYVWMGEDQVHAAIAVPPKPGFPYWTDYDWAMDQQKADKITAKRLPTISDFSNETLFSYGIDTRNTGELSALSYPDSDLEKPQ
jgi:hypothetical protein